MEQKSRTGRVGIASHDEGGAGRTNETDAPAAAIDGLAPAALVEVADDDDDAIVRLGKLGQGRQHPADAGVVGGRDCPVEKGHDRVQDNQERPDFFPKMKTS